MNPLSTQRIIQTLSTFFTIETLTLDILPRGADIRSSVYKAVAKDQSSYFVKLKQDNQQDIATEVLQLLDNVGIKQIIPPIKTNQGQLYQRMDDYTLLVYPFIEGHDGFNQPLTGEEWLTLGKALRKVHTIKVPTSLQQRIKRETYSPQWREIVRLVFTQIEAEPIDDEIAAKLQAFIKENAEAIVSLVDGAEQLAQQVQTVSPEFVLCHSDIHGGNVLIGEDHKLYIVDWDEPIMAPKERDLMFIGGGVGNVWNNPREEIIFYQGYGETEINRAILNYYRHERIVEDIAIYTQTILSKASDSGDRQALLQHFMDLFEPNGVVDIALKKQ